MTIIKCLIMIHHTQFTAVWQESQGALGKLSRVNTRLHSTLNNTVGQTVIKIRVKFKLASQAKLKVTTAVVLRG